MAQKVNIARAIVHRPPILILDEPTNGLDVMTTRAMRGFLQQLKSEGRCVIFSSHIMQEDEPERTAQILVTFAPHCSQLAHPVLPKGSLFL